jgi:outer membrane murein-binding lipoprotein Lpp
VAITRRDLVWIVILIIGLGVLFVRGCPGDEVLRDLRAAVEDSEARLDSMLTQLDSARVRLDSTQRAADDSVARARARSRADSIDAVRAGQRASTLSGRLGNLLAGSDSITRAVKDSLDQAHGEEVTALRSVIGEKDNEIRAKDVIIVSQGLMIAQQDSVILGYEATDEAKDALIRELERRQGNHFLGLLKIPKEAEIAFWAGVGFIAGSQASG